MKANRAPWRIFQSLSSLFFHLSGPGRCRVGTRPILQMGRRAQQVDRIPELPSPTWSSPGCWRRWPPARRYCRAQASLPPLGACNTIVASGWPVLPDLWGGWSQRIHVISCLSLPRLRNIPVPPSRMAARSGNGHAVAPFHGSGEGTVVFSEARVAEPGRAWTPSVRSVLEAQARADPFCPQGPV